jgi:MtN3 and saliva related transmembrane protein
MKAKGRRPIAYHWSPVAFPSSDSLIGLIAGTLTTLSFVPQVAKAWRRRSVNDLSLVMLLMFATGVALWLVYGFLNNAMPIIVANGVTLILALWLIGMKVRFR